VGYSGIIKSSREAEGQGAGEFKASLMEFRASLMEFKASLMEFKASLMEFKGSFPMPILNFKF
jgi:hypothetical protein